MSIVNLGTQTINWKYKTSLKGSNLSRMFNGCISPGIYLNNGSYIQANIGLITSYAGNQITINAFEAIFKASPTQTVHIGTSTAIALSTDGGLGYITESYPYITMSYSWADQIINYIDFAFKASGSINAYNLIIGKAIFTGGVVTSIDYSEASYPPYYNPTIQEYNVFGEIKLNGKKINKEVTTAIDTNTITNELICDTSLFFSPTADRTLDVTAGAHTADTNLYVYNNSATYKVTVTYFTATTFTILSNEYVKFKWNGVRWIIVESNSQEFIGWEECFYSLSRTAEIDGANHIYELTVTGDKTSYFKSGQKIKFTQDASTKYAIITYVETSGGNTILTVYGGTDYAISANAITSARLAKVNRPYDFNCNESKWTISVDFELYTRSSPVANTLYYTGNSFNGEKGSWKYKSKTNSSAASTSNPTMGSLTVIASNSSTTETNGVLKHSARGYQLFHLCEELEEVKTLSSRTVKFFLISCASSGVSSINFLGTSADFTGLKITPCGI